MECCDGHFKNGRELGAFPKHTQSLKLLKSFEVAKFVYFASKSSNKMFFWLSYILVRKTLTEVFLLLLCFQCWKPPCPVPFLFPVTLGLSEVRDGVAYSILLLVALLETLTGGERKGM